MADEVGSAFVSIIPTARGFGRNLSGSIGGQVDDVGKRSGRRFGAAFTSSSAAPIRSGFGSITALATGVAAVAGVRAFKGLIDDASDLGETTSKVAQIFGREALPALVKFSAGAAKALGQSKIGALDAAATFGVFGKSAGLQGPALANFSTGLVTLTSDMASFANTSPEEAVEAVGAALRGEAEPIRRFGVLLNDATLRQEALRLGLIKTVKTALTPQQRVLAAQAAIMRQTSDQQGDFARTSGGLANQQRILAAQFTNVKARLGEAFLPAAVAVVGFLNRGMIPAIGKLGTIFGPVFEKLVDGAKALFDLFVKGDFTGAFARIFNVQEDSPVVALLFRVRDAAIAAFGWIRDNVKPILVGLGVAFGVLFAPITSTVVAFGVLYARSKAFRRVVGVVASFVAKTLVPAFARFGEFVRDEAAPAVEQFARTLAAKAVPVLRRLGAFIVSSVIPALRAFGGFIVNTALPALGKLGVFIGTTLVPALVKVGTFLAVNLGPSFKAIAQVLVTNVLPALQGLWARFVQVLPTLVKVGLVVGKVVGTLLAVGIVILGKVLPPLIRFAGPVLTALFAGIGKAIGIIAGFVSAVLGVARVVVRVLAAVGRFVAGAVRFFVQFYTGTKAKIDAVVTFIGKLPGRAVTALVSLGPKLLEVARTGFGKLVTGAGEKFLTLVENVTGIPGRIVSALGDLGGLLWDAGIKIIGGLLSGMKHKAGEMLGWVGNLGGRIADLKGPLPKDRKLLTPAGQAIMRGLIFGIRSEMPALRDELAAVTRAIRVGAGAEVGIEQLVPAPRRASGRPQQQQTAAGVGGIALTQYISNPVPLTVPETTQRQLLRLAHTHGLAVA